MFYHVRENVHEWCQRLLLTFVIVIIHKYDKLKLSGLYTLL